MTYPHGQRVTALDRICELLGAPAPHSGFISADDPLFNALLDQTIENLMGGCGFEDAQSFRDQYDWAEEWIAEHPDLWEAYEHPPWLHPSDEAKPEA